MRKLLLLYILLICNFYNCQTIAVQYDFIVHNSMINKDFIFPSVIKVDNFGTKLYHVKFGIDNSGFDQIGNTMFVYQKGTQDYYLYSEEKKPTYIVDQISDKEYYFEDNYDNFQWKISIETKFFGDILLKKATSEFRGRNYTIWFDANSEIKAGPWKFNNLPGLVYEVSDEYNSFKWIFKSVEKLQSKVHNPFAEYKLPFLTYKDYPKLRYGLSARLLEDLKDNANNGLTEQPRNALEILFEWEK